MRRSGRITGTVIAIASLTAGGLLWQAPVASAATGCLTSSSDFDRDGVPDVAVGIPGHSGSPGAVQVRLSNKGKPFTTTISGAPGFGTALTSLSSYAGRGDEELCSQLVVGSPDESLSTDLRRSGVVYVYVWRSQNHRFELRGTFQPQSQGVKGKAQSGARFGAALAAEQRPAGQGGSQPTRLYVGAPGFDIDEFADTGSVTSFWIDADEDPSAHDTEITELGEPLSDEPTPGAALGSSLSVAGGVVAMGMPGFSAGDKSGAGGVVLEPVASNPDSPLTLLTQSTPGVPGTNERGNHFGASVHLSPGRPGTAPTLLVGTPGEDVGGIKDAGAVTVARISPTTLEPVGKVRTVNQNSAGMAGTAERGDQFGASVSTTRYHGKTVFLVGVPGEDVGRVRDAGMVQTIGSGKGWTQDSAGVPGRAEAGDRMGASLGGSVDTGATRPLIGVPGEDSSTGGVLIGLPSDGYRLAFPMGTHPGDRYGFSVGP